MNCPNCNEENKAGSRFCCGCGKPLETEPEKQPKEIVYRKADQPKASANVPQMRSEYNVKSIIYICAAIFGIVLLSNAHNEYWNDFLYFMLMGGEIFLLLISLLTLTRKVYDIKCPYCGRYITVESDAVAVDCAVCGERIIIENYRPRKK